MGKDRLDHQLLVVSTAPRLCVVRYGHGDLLIDATTREIAKVVLQFVLVDGSVPPAMPKDTQKENQT